MFRSFRAHGQSGFMSVESVANTIFYLIMIAVVTFIASTVMGTGKMASTTTALSMLRVNVQYVGTNVGDYADAEELFPVLLVPGLLTDVDPTTASVASTAVLPTGEVLTLTVAAATDPGSNGIVLGAASPTAFKMSIAAVGPTNCRRLAYYGLGAGYGVMVGAAIIVPGAGSVALVEGACVAGGAAVNLTSN